MQMPVDYRRIKYGIIHSLNRSSLILFLLKVFILSLASCSACAVIGCEFVTNAVDNCLPLLFDKNLYLLEIYITLYFYKIDASRQNLVMLRD